MTRCQTPAPRRTLLQLLPALALASFLASPVLAQESQSVRPFPANAKRATMVVTAPPELTLDGKAERLSPGARIWSDARMLTMSASLVGKKVVVNYVREPLGLVHEVWILNAAEIAQKPPAP